MLRLIEPYQTDRNPIVKLAEPVDAEFGTIGDMMLRLQLYAVTTTATGNCMMMVIVQAICDANSAEQDIQLVAATSSLKRGNKNAGKLHLGEQYSHEQRLATLIDVQRGSAGMERWPHRGNLNGTWRNSGSVHRSGTLAFMFTIKVSMNRSVCRPIACVGAYTSSPREVTGKVSGSAVCTGRVLSVDANKYWDRETTYPSGGEMSILIAHDEQSEDGQ